MPGLSREQIEKSSICLSRYTLFPRKQARFVWNHGLPSNSVDNLLLRHPPNISQRCACCAHTVKGLRLSQSKIACLEYEYTANSDVNGTRGILTTGYVVLAYKVNGTMLLVAEIQLLSAQAVGIPSRVTKCEGGGRTSIFNSNVKTSHLMALAYSLPILCL